MALDTSRGYVSRRDEDALDSHYRELEHRWQVAHDASYEALVVPNGNSAAPVHRWFHMKEAFSERLTSRVIDDLELANQARVSVVDAYCGSGTVGVSLAELVANRTLGEASFVGVETNPFLHLAASAKLRAVQEGPQAFERSAGRVAAAALRPGAPMAERPDLSTFRRADYVPPDHLDELLRLKAAIDTLFGDDRTIEADLARLCLGGCVEPATMLRRDGRALRFEPEKRPQRPIDEFLRRAALVSDDISASSARVDGGIVLGDARTDDTFSQVEAADLALFSPPYPNNIDYTEIYKLEAWLLGLIASDEEFAAQRRATVRSHPSLKFDERLDVSDEAAIFQVAALSEPVLAAVPDGDRYAAGRRRLVNGYVQDLFATLSHLRDHLRPGGHLVYVVGNSLHGSDGGGFVIAADLLIAAAAEIAGFEIDRIAIARRPRRRRTMSPYLRESIVFAHVPVRAGARCAREASAGTR